MAANSDIRKFNFFYRYLWKQEDFEAMQGWTYDTVGALAQAHADGNSAVLTGLAPSVVSGLTLRIALGIATNVDGEILVLGAASDVAVTSPAAQPRWDLVVLRPTKTEVTPIEDPSNPAATVFLHERQGSTVVVIPGTESASPAYPSAATGDVILTGVKAVAGQTTLLTADFDLSVRALSYVFSGPNVSVAGRVPAFADTSGKKVSDSGRVAASLVDGPASATEGAVAVFDGATGKILKNGTKLEANLVTGPAGSDNDRVAVFDGVTGKILKNSSLDVGTIVAGPAAAVDSEIALFDSTTGKLIKRATGTGYAKVASGVLQNPVTTIPSADLTGRTDAAFGASGRIGERIVQSITTTFQSSATAGNFQDSAESITLSAGLWLLMSRCSLRMSSNASASALSVLAELRLTDAANAVQARHVAGAYFAGASQAASFPVLLSVPVSVSTSTTYKLRLVSNQANVPTGAICLVDANNTTISGNVVTESVFIAVRIG